jgi:dTDP-glucose 4,6-dehydratase
MQTKNTTKNILLTGTAGFIGSNFVPYFLNKYPDYNLINLDLLTYAGTLDNLKECENNPRYKFIKGDICNRELVEFIFAEYDINGVIHFAAESHVDNSIKNPGVFVQTNVTGTFTLIDVAYKYWMDKPFEYKSCHSPLDGESYPRFHHISTDEVYGTLSLDAKDKERYGEIQRYQRNTLNFLCNKSKETMDGLNEIIQGCINED